MNQTFSITQVGTLHQKDNVYCLELNKRYSTGLSGIEGFSHLKVLWWAHGFDTPDYRNILYTDKPYVTGPEKIGIFATRSPIRPNLIMTSTASVKNIDYNKCTVELHYIDAADGTPVIDIKPYTPSEDRIRDYSVPSWCQHWPQWYEDSATFDWSKEFTFPC